MKNVDLDTIITRLKDNDEEIQSSALKILHHEILAVQGSAGYNQQEIYDKLGAFEEIAEKMNKENQEYLYSLLSVMNIFNSDKNVIKYCLMGNIINIEEWGLQYIRKLVFCILEIINKNMESEDYTRLVEPIVRFLFKHNSEIEAIDFIFEISFIPLKNQIKLDKNTIFKNDYSELIYKYMDNENKDRIILYLEELDVFYNMKEIISTVYLQYPSKYLVYLIKNNMLKESIEYVRSLDNLLLRKQCLYILAKNMIYYESDLPEEKYILSNSFLADNFFKVAESLELLSSLKGDFIIKGSDRSEAFIIANGLVHFAYGRDPIFFPEKNDAKIPDEFIRRFKNQIVTDASIGLINSYSHEKIIALNSAQIYETPCIGPILALAIAAQKHHDLDSGILDLLKNFVASDCKDAIPAMLGVSILYSCSNSQEAYDMLFPLFSSSNLALNSFAIYVLSTVFAGSGDVQIISSCNEFYRNIKKDTDFSLMAILGIALQFLKNPDLKTSPVLNELDSYTKLLALGLMYIGTGNAAVADEILNEAFTGDSDPLLEVIGLISSSLIGIGDSIATDLLERISSSALLLDSSHLRNVFPFCLALLYTSNPKLEVIDSLERSINSGDADCSSVISLGIVGAGTRSSRILRVLEANAASFQKDPKLTAAMTISEGLVNLGKGLFTLSPLYYENKVISNRSIVGLLSAIFIFLSQNLIEDYPYLFYSITTAISPKYVVGFEGNCKVGRPVNVVGLAGNPNKISATVVHSLPVVLNVNEKAECDDPIYTCYTEDVLVKMQ